jgi:hypothetical protein
MLPFDDIFDLLSWVSDRATVADPMSDELRGSSPL